MSEAMTSSSLHTRSNSYCLTDYSTPIDQGSQMAHSIIDKLVLFNLSYGLEYNNYSTHKTTNPGLSVVLMPVIPTLWEAEVGGS